MPEPNAAEVLEQDGPVNKNADAEANNAGEANANETDGEHQNGGKRLGGWQRKIQKLERENEVLRELAVRTRPQETTVEQVEDEPKPPDIETFSGTTEEFKKAQQEFPSNLKAYWESQRQQQVEQESLVTAAETLNEKVRELPEVDEIRAAFREMRPPERLMNLIQRTCALQSNGAEVLREVLLDPEHRKEMMDFGRVGDGASIAAKLHGVSAALRMNSK